MQAGEQQLYVLDVVDVAAEAGARAEAGAETPEETQLVAAIQCSRGRSQRTRSRVSSQRSAGCRCDNMATRLMSGVDVMCDVGGGGGGDGVLVGSG